MDSSGNDPLVALLCFAPFACGIILVFGGGLALMFWLLRGQFKPKDAATLVKERKAMEARVGELKQRLRPWTSGSLADLSTDWNSNWVQVVRDLSAPGTIPALSDPKGPALVAFDLRERGGFPRNGQLLAATTDQTFYYRIADKTVSIDVDGVFLGKLNSDGTILGADGKPIGSAIRPGGQPFIFSIGRMSVRHDERERSYDVSLNGRTIGRLANPPIQVLNAFSSSDREFSPAVVVEGFPTDEEETWLLALAILQIAGVNLADSVWSRPSNMTGVP